MEDKNPYQPPASAAGIQTEPRHRTDLRPRRLFWYSYGTSLLVALLVVTIWFTVMYLSLPPSQRRSGPLGVLELLFPFITTLPSVMTCTLFSWIYCFIVKPPEKRKAWPAVLFGALSGLVFNAMTAILLIESLFSW